MAAIGAYTPITFANDPATTSPLSATNMQHMEDQIKNITDAAVSGGADPTKIWTSTNDGNAGQPPAPKPRDSASNVGHWVQFYLSGAATWTNPGGTWAYFYIRHDSGGHFAGRDGSVTTGNIVGNAGETLAGFVWRIA